MANPKKPAAEHSRITRTPGTKAPRAARKRKPLAEETAAEIFVAPAEPTPPPVAVEVVDVAVVDVAVVAELAPARPREEPHAQSPWIGLDGRAIIRAAVKRLGRALARRIPVLGLFFRV
jgi:hypothetical protein